jgi:hypothetical protein
MLRRRSKSIALSKSLIKMFSVDIISTLAASRYSLDVLAYDPLSLRDWLPLLFCAHSLVIRQDMVMLWSSDCKTQQWDDLGRRKIHNAIHPIDSFVGDWLSGPFFAWNESHTARRPGLVVRIARIVMGIGKCTRNSRKNWCWNNQVKLWSVREENRRISTWISFSHELSLVSS